MKKLSICLTLALALLVSSLAGCTQSNDSMDPSEAVAIVYGAHRYNPAINVNESGLKNEIKTVAETNGYVCVTVCDGDPFSLNAFDLTIEDKGQSATKIQQIANANVEYVLGEIANTKAITPEVDTLSAITQASKNVSSSDKKIRKLIIYDNGLQTTGYLDMASENIIESEPEYIVKELESQYAIPDLSNIDEIIWYGLGQVRGNQPTLSSYYSKKLMNIWNAILEAGNAQSIKFVEQELCNDYEDSDLPSVTIIPIISESIKGQANNTPIESDKIIKLDDTILSFKGDSADFVNVDVAEKTLNDVADKLYETTGTVYIVGSTATVGSKESCEKLSIKRANKVKKELEKRGVNCNLISKGVGCSACPIRTVDLDSNGNLIEKQAKKNRAVFIISEDNSIIKELKSKNLI